MGPARTPGVALGRRHARHLALLGRPVSELVPQAHDGGAVVFVTRRERRQKPFARRDAGADVVVAQGWEAGGHVRGHGHDACARSARRRRRRPRSGRRRGRDRRRSWPCRGTCARCSRRLDRDAVPRRARVPGSRRLPTAIVRRRRDRHVLRHPLRRRLAAMRRIGCCGNSTVEAWEAAGRPPAGRAAGRRRRRRRVVPTGRRQALRVGDSARRDDGRSRDASELGGPGCRPRHPRPARRRDRAPSSSPTPNESSPSRREDHRRLAQGAHDPGAERARHAADVGPRPRERLQHRRALGRRRAGARPLRRAPGRWASRRSRAAPSRAVFVESDPEAVRAIERNLDKLGLTGARVVRRDAVTVSRRKPGAGRKYDLVLADPPYDDDRLPVPRPATCPACSPTTGCSSSRPSAKTEPELPGSQCARRASTAPRG